MFAQLPVRRQEKEPTDAKTYLDKRRYISSKVRRKVNQDMSTDKHCDKKRRAAVNNIKQAMRDLQRKIDKLVKVQRKANKRVKMITTTERPSNSAMYHNEKLGFLHSNNLANAIALYQTKTWKHKDVSHSGGHPRRKS